MRFISLLHIFFSFLTLFAEDQNDVEIFAKSLINEYKEQDIENPIIDLEGMPNGVVAGAVNVITGHYIESGIDLEIPSSNPIIVYRSFSNSQKRDTLCHGWDLNIFGKIDFYTDPETNEKSAIIHESGGEYLFDKKSVAHHKMSISKDIIKFGVTNASSGHISARNNLLNKILYGKTDSKNYSLSTEGGEKSIFKKIDYGSYLLQSIQLTNNCQYHFEYDKKDRLKNVISLDQNSNELGRLYLEYPENFIKDPILTLKSLDGRYIIYKFKRMDSKDTDSHHRYCLQSQISSFAPQVSFDYMYVSKYKADRVSRKNLPDNRYLEIKYYEKGINFINDTRISISDSKDSRVGRVASLSSPLGPDSNPIISYKFFYTLNRHKKTDKPIGGRTEVLDPLGFKTVYNFNDEQRLKAIKSYTKDDQLYRTENIYWGSKNSSEYTLLKARTLCGQDGIIHKSRHYKYDKHGNVLEDIVAGNLSGNCFIPIEISDDGNLVENGCERYVKRYEYTSKNQVKKEIDHWQTTFFEYYPNSDLLRLKLVYDEHGICERYYFEYDQTAALALEIHDDGNSSDINDLSNVTLRRIKRIQNSTSIPIGLPEVIEDLYHDLSLNLEISLKKAVNTYSIEGFLTRQDVYDANGDFVYCIKKDYNERGKVIKETDPLGQITTFKYDENGNCIYKQGPNQGYYTGYSYDYSNRLIGEDEIYSNGIVFHKSYLYDYKSQKILECDIYGNETKYVYDEFGRIIEIQAPILLNAQPKINIGYDIANNQTEKIDSNGNITTLSYTVHCKPLCIHYPDGGIEKNEYHPDGTLKKTIDPKGGVTCYQYDYKKRKTRVEQFSSTGDLLIRYCYNYSAFNLLSETDPENHTTYYFYDDAGRVSCIKKGDIETRHYYDANGRANEIWEVFDEGEYKITKYEFDVVDRIIEERLEDNHNNIFSIKYYQYDVDGNLTRTGIQTEKEISFSSTYYNSHKKPTQIITPDGQTIHIYYKYDYFNDLGQNVEFLQQIDPKGNITAKIFDALGNIVLEEFYDPLGRLLKKTSFSYDGERNLLERSDAVIKNFEIDYVVTTSFEHDALDRMKKIIEALGSEEEKTTEYEYNSIGELTKIIKPDQTVINHSYDSLGRLTELSSSDNSIHYSYEYDNNNNLICTLDHILNQFTNRKYDYFDQLVSEELGNGLIFSYKYDLLGRVKEFTLPDQTSVFYSYDARNLRIVTRVNTHKTYCNSYQYDISGRLIDIELADNLGHVELFYDKALRPTDIRSQYFSQNNITYDVCGNILGYDLNDLAGKTSVNFEYDSLHQLISENGVFDHTYTFDSVHNRLNKDDINYNNNILNQLTSQDQTNYAYDKNGNLTKRKSPDEKFDCRYDALDRLIEVKNQHMKYIYHYDASNRRLAKIAYELINDIWVKTDLKRYLYQGEKDIGFADEQGRIVELAILGVGKNRDIGAHAAFEIDDQVLLPVHTYRGDVSALINIEQVKIEEIFRYSAFGEELIFDVDGQLKSDAICSFRFSSKRKDPETGWLYFGRRFYDPEIGRWTTPDPLWFENGPNLYGYVQNRPLLFVDPDGLLLASALGFLNVFSDFELMADYANTCFNWNHGSFKTEHSRSETYTIKGKQHNNIAFSFTNGINNSLDESKESAEIISRMAGGAQVRGVYNATHGIFDPVECIMGFFGIETAPVRLLRETWNESFQNLSDSGILVHSCHSQGVIHTRNALESYPQELRSRMLIIAVAPASYIDKYMCEKIQHIVSKGDMVHKIDMVGRLRNQETIIELDPHLDANFIDHNFDSPTFGKELEDLIISILNRYLYE